MEFTRNYSTEEKKEIIKKHLVAISENTYHVKKGHNSVEGFKNLYTDPDGQPTFPGHHDDVLIGQCITELQEAGVFN